MVGALADRFDLCGGFALARSAQRLGPRPNQSAHRSVPRNVTVPIRPAQRSRHGSHFTGECRQSRADWRGIRRRRACSGGTGGSKARAWRYPDASTLAAGSAHRGRRWHVARICHAACDVGLVGQTPYRPGAPPLEPRSSSQPGSTIAGVIAAAVRCMGAEAPIFLTKASIGAVRPQTAVQTYSVGNGRVAIPNDIVVSIER